MKAKDSQEVIDLFVKNVYGENKELAMASFNEIEALRTANELFAEKEAEITMLTLEKSSYAQLLDDAKHDIARLNAQIEHMADKLGKEHEAHVRDLVNKDAVMRAMAETVSWNGEFADTVDEIIDHFTREQEAKDNGRK
jgi:hypothetical protein